MISQKCRFYENQTPQIGDAVAIEYIKIEPIGVYVELLEYKHLDGLLTTSELTSQQIKNLKNKIGFVDIACVLNIDEKGNIDLTKRNLTKTVINNHKQKYFKAKTVHNIMEGLSKFSSTDIEELYNSIGWPLYKSHGHAYDGFVAIRDDPSLLQLDSTLKHYLLKIINQKIPIKMLDICCVISVKYYGREGIEVIKKALRKGVANNITVRLLNEDYVVSTSTSNKLVGIENVGQSVEAIRLQILNDGGMFEIVKPTYIKNEVLVHGDDEEESDKEDVSDEEQSNSESESDEECNF